MEIVNIENGRGFEFIYENTGSKYMGMIDE